MTLRKRRNSSENRARNLPSNPGRQLRIIGSSAPVPGSDHENCGNGGLFQQVSNVNASVTVNSNVPRRSSRLSGFSGSAESSQWASCQSSEEHFITQGRNTSKGSKSNVLIPDVKRDSNTEVNSCSVLQTVGYVAIIVVVLYGIIIGFQFCKGNEQLQQFYETINKVTKNFPSQDQNLWNNFFYGIKTIISEDPTKPSVFLLLYNSDKEKQTSKSLAREIGKGAAEFLSQAKKEPLILEGENLQNSTLIEDYGWFLDKYRGELEERHVMILYDLQDTPAVVAQSFHALCDRQHPLIEKAALFFTLHVEETLENKKSVDIADRTLRSLWERQLGEDISEPLITRITDRVLSVRSEDNLFM